MARIFGGLPGMKALVSYWYHFAVMFEALFILTTIDTGTRVGRFLVQELAGRFRPSWGRTDNHRAGIAATALVVGGWTYFIWTNNVATIWPMFGIANQLLAVVGLAVVTTIFVNEGKARYVWVTITPMLFVATTTLLAAYQSIRYNPNFLAATHSASAALRLKGWLNAGITAALMAGIIGILADCAIKWVRRWNVGVGFAADAAEGPVSR
jgi:carbon starvation protein